MTRKIGNVWPQIISKENISLAIDKASRGKKNRKAVKRVLANREFYIDKIHDMLVNKTFTTGGYRIKVIHEPKERVIHILNFYPDRIVQHAIMNVMEPYWDDLLIDQTYSCRKGKGQHRASNYCLYQCCRFKYCVQGDIHKFYPSIDHKLLKDVIRKKVKDKNLLWLLDDIIDSVDGEVEVPIGNLLSQWFGNLYMDKFDRFVKNELKVKGYCRYCDDFLLFFDDLEEANKVQRLMETFLFDNLNLALSRNKLLATKNGVNFLGYKHFSDGRKLLKRETLIKLRRNLKKLDLTHIVRARSQVSSYYGELKNCNGNGLFTLFKFSKLFKKVGIKHVKL